MPSKKKKFNARFPPARIKKIMQTDEEVGKVAAPVPVIISRALELFIESLIVKSSNITKARHAKTLSTAHIKHTILSEKRFDFLKDLVANIADVQADEEGAENVAVCSRNTDIEPGAKTRGRPRKKKADGKPALKPRVKRQKKLDEDPDTEETDTATEEPASDEDEDDNEDEDEDDDEEDTETDPDTQDSPKTESSVATSLTGPSQNLQYGRSSPEPQATCSQLQVNTYPQSKAGCGTNQTLTHSHLDQQTHSLDLRINQNKQSSSDQLETKSYTQSEQTTSPAMTCQGHTHSDGTQSMHSTRSSPTSTQVGDGDCRSIVQSESIGQLKSQSNLQSDARCSEDDGCQQTEAPADQQVSFTVRQMVDKDDDKNKDSVGQENRLQASHSNETIPESDSHAGARLGTVDCAPRDSYPVYGGIPPVSMPFYPHHLGIMQQVNPYPAHMRPMPDGMSPYPPGLMPYQAMAFPGHAVLPHVTHLPSMMDSRFGMPRMNSVSGASVQSGFSESVMAGQPPPAHTKQSQNITLAHQDKDEHPTS